MTKYAFDAANDNIPAEAWKSVPSIPCLEASTHGRVRRIPYLGEMPNGGTRIYKSSARFGTITYASSGARHLFFNAMYSGIGNVKVHFAVCEAFNGPPPTGLKRVRHLNENGLDNRPENLAWAAQKTNMNDPVLKNYQRRRISPKAKSELTPAQKRAGIYDSILDIGIRQAERRRGAANDNISASEFTILTNL